jgi:hypothetical protein
VIAILTNNVARAVNEIQRRGDLEEFKAGTRRGTFKSRREFVVVTELRELQGLGLADYMVIGYVEPELVELARTRMVG